MGGMDYDTGAFVGGLLVRLWDDVQVSQKISILGMGRGTPTPTIKHNITPYHSSKSIAKKISPKSREFYGFSKVFRF